MRLATVWQFFFGPSQPVTSTIIAANVTIRRRATGSVGVNRQTTGAIAAARVRSGAAHAVRAFGAAGSIRRTLADPVEL